MIAKRFWVVGGQYADTTFKVLTCDRPQVAGPFEHEEEARAAWRDLYARESGCALTRFSIVHENLRLAS
jgi:hypothetical protein